MKPTTDLCNRVLGSGSICGIYKITNKQTGDIYIGQSVNIADRWKQHVKCGLGIDASATNKHMGYGILLLKFFRNVLVIN